MSARGRVKSRIVFLICIKLLLEKKMIRKKTWKDKLLINILRSASSSKIWPGIEMDFFCLLGSAISKFRSPRRCFVCDLKCWWSRVREVDFLLSSNGKIFTESCEIRLICPNVCVFFWFLSILARHKSFCLYHVAICLENFTSQTTKQISFCTLCHLSRLSSHKINHLFDQTISWCLRVSNVRISSKAFV
jgi:hypothetical protein